MHSIRSPHSRRSDALFAQRAIDHKSRTLVNLRSKPIDRGKRAHFLPFDGLNRLQKKTALFTRVSLPNDNREMREPRGTPDLDVRS